MPTAPSPAAAAHGPDWVDIAQFLNAIWTTHGITASFELRTGPGTYVGAVQVTLRANAPQLQSTGCAWDCVLVEAFPGNKRKTLEGVCFYLLHKLDAIASRERWYQSELPIDVVAQASR